MSLLIKGGMKLSEGIKFNSLTDCYASKSAPNYFVH